MFSDNNYLFIVRVNSEMGTFCHWCNRYLEKKDFMFITRVYYNRRYVTLCPICEDVFVADLFVLSRELALKSIYD